MERTSAEAMSRCSRIWRKDGRFRGLLFLEGAARHWVRAGGASWVLGGVLGGCRAFLGPRAEKGAQDTWGVQDTRGAAWHGMLMGAPPRVGAPPWWGAPYHQGVPPCTAHIGVPMAGPPWHDPSMAWVPIVCPPGGVS